MKKLITSILIVAAAAAILVLVRVFNLEVCSQLLATALMSVAVILCFLIFYKVSVITNKFVISSLIIISLILFKSTIAGLSITTLLLAAMISNTIKEDMVIYGKIALILFVVISTATMHLTGFYNLILEFPFLCSMLIIGFIFNTSLIRPKNRPLLWMSWIGILTSTIIFISNFNEFKVVLPILALAIAYPFTILLIQGLCKIQFEDIFRDFDKMDKIMQEMEHEYGH